MKTRLNVPYREKDEAKALGARFDMAGKFWYVPDGIDLASFKKWLPEDLQAWLEAKLPGKKKAKSPAE